MGDPDPNRVSTFFCGGKIGAFVPTRGGLLVCLMGFFVSNLGYLGKARHRLRPYRFPGLWTAPAVFSLMLQIEVVAPIKRV